MNDCSLNYFWIREQRAVMVVCECVWECVNVCVKEREWVCVFVCVTWRLSVRFSS